MSPDAGGPHDDGGVLQGSACTQGDAGYGGPRFGLGKAKRGPFPNDAYCLADLGKLNGGEFKWQRYDRLLS